jgi:hypothetical protein
MLQSRTNPLLLRARISVLIGVMMMGCIAATSAMPHTLGRSVSFQLGSAAGKERFTYPLTLSEQGCILARVDSWSETSAQPKAKSLALIINGSDQKGYYARNDGVASAGAPLVASYALDRVKASRKLQWTISVVNFSGQGTANGRLQLELPPSQMPCEFAALVGRTRGNATLRWRYTGQPPVQRFIAEQSADGRVWTAMAACNLTPKTSNSYSCPVLGLTSGQTYYFRVCSIVSGSATRCDGARSISAPSVKLIAP